MPVPVDPSRQAQLDRAAQAQGFHNYEEYRLWTIQREQKHVGSVEGGGQGGAPTPTPTPAPNNQLHGSIGGMLDYVRRAMGGH